MNPLNAEPPASAAPGANTSTYLAAWQAHLQRALKAAIRGRERRGDFDMNDAPEMALLAPFPELQQAIVSLERQVAQPWREADAEALVNQRRHERLTQVAVVTGAGAIIFTIVLLALKLSWPGLVSAAFWPELAIMAAGVAAVGIGWKTKSDHKWLGWRHRAERLRMLKFKALAQPELWSGQFAAWKEWLNRQVQAIPKATEMPLIEKWAADDAAEPAPAGSAAAAPDQRCALIAYYRHKRLLFQCNYFHTKGRKAANSRTVRLREWRVGLFVVTIVCVLIHLGADIVAAALERHQHDAFRGWEVVSMWAVVLAAVLPVIGIGVRAWSSAFELSRKARAFAAKQKGMAKAAKRLAQGTEELPAVLTHLGHDELFLEQEHREWLRLLLDAEWFL